MQLVRGGIRGRDPRVLKALMAREAAAGVHDEEVGDEILGLNRHLVPVRRVELERPGPNLPDEHGAGLAEKRREAAQHRVEHHPHRPQVCLRPVTIALLQEGVQHLRRHVPAAPNRWSNK